MDYTWSPIEHDDGHEADAPRASAMDYVRNAWALLRGTGPAAHPHVHAHGQAQGVAIAQASLAAAGGRMDEYNEVEFVKQCWALYQQAMEEGWVAEWIEQFTTKDVKCMDYIGDVSPGQQGPLIFKGHSGLCKFYNLVLKNVWNNGNSTVVWKPTSFTAMGRGSGVVMAEFDIQVTPRGISHPKQLWIYRVEHDKITDVYIYPLGEGGPPRSTPVEPAMPTPMSGSYSSLNAANTPLTNSQGHTPLAGHNETPPMPAMNNYQSQYAESHSTEAPSLVDLQTPRPSGTMPGSMGVALTRPCSHNSWDNVRIKRGWAILRCRICQSQWRLRPTAIPHCPDFARGAGCCPRGTDCTQLHVHRTREQSSEAKKAAQGPTGSGTQTPLSLPNATHSPGNSPSSAGYSSMQPPPYAYPDQYLAHPGQYAPGEHGRTSSYSHDPYDAAPGRATPQQFTPQQHHVAVPTHSDEVEADSD